MKSGGEIISLLYIINNKRYKEYLETGKFKYILPILTASFYSKILKKLIIREEVKGDIAGLNLKELDYKERKTLEKMINHINKLKNDRHRYIFIEELMDASLDIKEELEAKTCLCFPREDDLKIYNIKIILEKILESRNYLKEEELLIVSRDRELTYKIINLLYEKFPFISIFNNGEWGSAICKDILNDIGLSIFIEKDLKKSIKKYSIIINIEKDISIDEANIKKEAIVFDYSNAFKFRNSKTRLLIEDVTIANKDGQDDLIPKELISSIYEKINGNDKESFHRVYSRGKLYTLEELMKKEVRSYEKTLKPSV